MKNSALAMPGLAAAELGDRPPADALFADFYSELLRLGRRQLARVGAALTLGTTTLLHEAYLSMSARDGTAFPAFPDRARFMAYAARAMRGLIVDHARRRHALKRGGCVSLTTIGDEVAAPDVGGDPGQLSLLSDALDELALVEPALAQVVDLRFFCGFSFQEIATMQGLSERTVQRHWEKARIYLHRAM